MRKDEAFMADLIRALADEPKADNRAYLRAISEARQAFREAEAELGGPVQVKMKVKRKHSDRYVVKWTFTLADT